MITTGDWSLEGVRFIRIFDRECTIRAAVDIASVKREPPKPFAGWPQRLSQHLPQGFNHTQSSGLDLAVGQVRLRTTQGYIHRRCRWCAEGEGAARRNISVHDADNHVLRHQAPSKFVCRCLLKELGRYPEDNNELGRRTLIDDLHIILSQCHGRRTPLTGFGHRWLQKDDSRGQQDSPIPIEHRNRPFLDPIATIPRHNEASTTDSCGIERAPAQPTSGRDGGQSVEPGSWRARGWASS